MGFRSRYKAGEFVEVRSKRDILRTLDRTGALDGMPFMPEMLAHCGRRYQVFASAHKTCDTVNKTGGRRVPRAVHLEGLRCNGSAHGGCQARCLLFWKEAWLKPVSDTPSSSGAKATAGDCDEALLMQSVRQPGDDPKDPTYRCQATRLPEASWPLRRWTPRQYVADVTSGNVALREAFRILVLACIYRLRELRWGYRATTTLYERVHRLFRGSPSPYGQGLVAPGCPTPHQVLDLEVGETVRVKPHVEILATINHFNRNRGLSFDKEMVRYCGQELRVVARVSQIINEQTGKITRMPTPSVQLEGAFCTSQYSERRLMCPRRIVPFWREIWLERISADVASERQSDSSSR